MVCRRVPRQVRKGSLRVCFHSPFAHALAMTRSTASAGNCRVWLQERIQTRHELGQGDVGSPCPPFGVAFEGIDHPFLFGFHIASMNAPSALVLLRTRKGSLRAVIAAVGLEHGSCRGRDDSVYQCCKK